MTDTLLGSEQNSSNRRPISAFNDGSAISWMGTTMSTFIVPVDGSATSTESLAFGYQMASSLGAKLGIVFVGELSAPGAGQLVDLLPAATGNGRCVDTFTLDVPPDTRLAAWLAGLERPLVVLETHSQGSDRLNDVTRWMARNAGPCVTTLVGRSPAQIVDIRRLLVPLDGSAAAEAILPLATLIALRSNATLGMVRVVPPHAVQEVACHDDRLRIEQERDEARAYLDHMARELRKRGVQSTWEVRIGDAGAEIARAAQTTASDLILMASQHYHGRSDPGGAGVANAAILGTNIPIIVAEMTTSAVNPG